MLLKSVLGILYSVQFILAVKGNGVHSLRPAFCRLVCPLKGVFSIAIAVMVVV